MSWRAAPLIEAGGGGSVIHISSISGMASSSESVPYSAINAAVIHLTATQAKALAEKNIRVNCVAPGTAFFEGCIWDEVRRDAQKLFDEVVDEILFGRMGPSEEITKATAFLASALAYWIIGDTRRRRRAVVELKPDWIAFVLHPKTAGDWETGDKRDSLVDGGRWFSWCRSLGITTRFQQVDLR